MKKLLSKVGIILGILAIIVPAFFWIFSSNNEVLADKIKIFHKEDIEKLEGKYVKKDQFKEFKEHFDKFEQRTGSNLKELKQDQKQFFDDLKDLLGHP